MTEWEELALKIEQEDWRELAASIAVTVLTYLRQHEMTKQQLAEKMGVKPQYISRVVKGKANLTLDTIVKLEKALGEQIITVSDPTACVAVNPSWIALDAQWFVFYQASSQKPIYVGARRHQKVQYSSMKDSYDLVS